MSNITFGQLPNQPSITGATIVPTVSANINYTVTVANLRNYMLSTAGNISANSVSVSGAVTANSVATAGTVSAQGNITGAYLLGNGSQLTGITVNYSNANVAAFLPVYNGNVQSTTVWANNVAVQGRDWVQMQYCPDGVPHDQNYIGTGSWFYLDSDGAVFESNTTGSSRSVTMSNTGNLSAIGNVTGSYFLGNGSQLTGIVATTSYSNANVIALLSAYGNNISSTGNIVAANVTASFTISSQGNVVGQNLLTTGYISAVGNISAGNVSAVGNVAGTYILGNGSQLTGVISNYSNANVANYLPTFSGNIGNLTVTGNIVTVGTTTLNTYIETTANTVNTGNSFTPNWGSGPVQQITANANFSLNAPTGMVTGSSITLVISQDATGNRVMTPNAVYKFGYGVNALSTTANAIDMMSVFYTGNNYLCNLVKGYS